MAELNSFSSLISENKPRKYLKTYLHEVQIIMYPFLFINFFISMYMTISCHLECMRDSRFARLDIKVYYDPPEWLYLRIRRVCLMQKTSRPFSMVYRHKSSTIKTITFSPSLICCLKITTNILLAVYRTMNNVFQIKQIPTS